MTDLVFDKVKEVKEVEAVEAVEEVKEKKWRPFTIGEFNEVFEIGQLITVRTRLDDSVHGKWLYTGYSIFHNEIIENLYANYENVYLNNQFYMIKELFEVYEYQDADGNWHRFGVEE